jgi:hypothetical protein
MNLLDREPTGYGLGHRRVAQLDRALGVSNYSLAVVAWGIGHERFWVQVPARCPAWGRSMSIEEWWGRTFERRGSVRITSMPDSSISTIQQLPTEDVAELYRSEGAHDHPSVRGILAGIELRRRENWTGRAALIVSVVALFVAAVFH